MSDDANARLASVIFFGGNAIFSDLRVGEQFRFPTNPTDNVCTKLNGNRYEYCGKTFQTGMRTAVKRFAA